MDVEELITAVDDLEAENEQLAERRLRLDFVVELEADVVDLRAQLAEAQAELALTKDMMVEAEHQHQAEIAASQAEVERLRGTLEEYADSDYWQDKAFGRGESKVDFDGDYIVWVGDGSNGFDLAQKALVSTTST